MSLTRRWFDERTSGAPPRLVERARLYVGTDDDSGAELAAAGAMALEGAISAGEGRDAALDLLAADALITMALLKCAERDPRSLGKHAAALRQQALTGVSQ
jgi:hypothetical protein